MSTTFYQLYNGKRRLISLILILLSLIAFFFPFLNVVFQGKTVSKITGFEMLFGQRGFNLIKDMGLDMGLTRQQLGDMAVLFGYIITPLLTMAIPVACMLLAINFVRQSTRGGAILCAVMMLVSLGFYHMTMTKYDGKALITLRVAKRYVTESADKSKQVIVNQTPKFETAATQEEKAALEKEIDVAQKQNDIMAAYLTFFESNVNGWEHIQTFTDVQDKAKTEASFKLEEEKNVLLTYQYAKVIGINTVDIVKILMLLAILSAGVAGVGKYKMAQ